MDISRKIGSEFIGSLLLLATVVGSGIMAERLAAGNTAIALLGNTIPTGAILYVLITMLGPVSGAHFNPAVTFAAALRGELRYGQASAYVAAQIGGAIAGMLLAHAMFDLDLFQVSAKARTGPGQWLSEAVAVSGLLTVIFMTLRSAPQSVATSVALYITAAYWFTASTSFANPAVTIARAMTDTFSGIRPGDAPAFIAAQLIGALLAVSLDRWFTVKT